MSKKSKVEYSQDFLESLYKEMLFYRRFEEQVNRAYNAGKFAGFCHLHIGQEGLCVGVQRNLIESDYVISGYRSHTQAIAKGVDAKSVFAELLGKSTGCAKGKGGSMHMFSKEKRFLGGHGIVGGQVPLATGVGFKIRYDNENDISVCYLGDGAQNQGQFYEALNMAATWDLPVLYVIENNRYGMGTDIRRVTSVDHLWKRALAFDMAHSDVDGMDVLKVYEHTKEVITYVREKKKPYLLEALTYRYRGHSVSDPATYRTKDELEGYQAKDPITQLAKQMQKQFDISDEKLKEWDKEIKAQVKACEAFADESSEPPMDWAYQDVFAANDNGGGELR
jgi:pyruvate dehydrogenase E1 component alpha subunit